MNHWYLTFCLVVATLFGGVDYAYGDARCLDTPRFCSSAQLCSDKLLGSDGQFSLFYPDHLKQALLLRLSCVPASAKKELEASLKTTFIKLTKNQRKKIQQNLLDLGFYNSSVDGLYGKGTFLALSDYKKNHFMGSNKSDWDIATELLNEILALKRLPKIDASSSDLPSCIFDLKKLFHNCFASHTFLSANSSFYTHLCQRV